MPRHRRPGFVERGFGVITTCAAHVTRDGQGWKGALGADSDDLLPGLRRLASAIRAHGATSIVQIFHGGLRSPSSLGGVWTGAEAEALVAKGASAVALGRAAIANPDWAARATDPAWQPRRPPLTIAELRERALNETFAQSMRNWKGFVADAG